MDRFNFCFPEFVENRLPDEQRLFLAQSLEDEAFVFAQLIECEAGHRRTPLAVFVRQNLEVALHRETVDQQDIQGPARAFWQGRVFSRPRMAKLRRPCA